MSRLDAAGLVAALSSLTVRDEDAVVAARARQAQLTKPRGSLGRLEELATFFAGWQGVERPTLDRAQALIFAGNHGVAALGVSAFPPAVTTQMMSNFRTGGAAINILAASAGLELRAIALDLDRPTGDFTRGPAMTAEDCAAALETGANAVQEKAELLVVGEMGIGNSTSAAALCCRSFGGCAEDWTGRGTGIEQDVLARKIDVVGAGVKRHQRAANTPFETLRRVGGREIAAIAGAVVAARRRRVPVMLDGFIACAAVAPMAACQPRIIDHCIAGHVSAERGHRLLLEKLGLRPLLDLDLRLGEGSGGALAVSLVRAALAVHRQMATFAEAGVSEGS